MTATSHFIQFGKHNIDYDIVRSKKRNKIEIVVLDNDKVKVLVPIDKPTDEIHRIVKSSSKWIFQKQLRLRERKNTRLTYSDGSILPYLGREYLLRVIDSNDNNRHESFSFKKGKFIVQSKGKEPYIIRGLYEKWLEKKAISILEKSMNSVILKSLYTRVLIGS